MTDVQRILELVEDAVDIAANKTGAVCLWDLRDELKRIRMEMAITEPAREAARSAGGEPCDHNWAYPMSVGDPPTFCKKCGAPKVRLQDMTAAPAPAETTAQQECTFPNCQCPHVEPKRGNLRECRALEVTHPGPRPVSEPALATAPCRCDPRGCRPDLLANGEYCREPTPPDAAQGKPQGACHWNVQQCHRREQFGYDRAVADLNRTTPPHPEGRAGELRECPFCGEHLLKRERSAFHPENECFLSGIGALGTLEIDEHDYAAWNRRPSRGEAGDANLAKLRDLFNDIASRTYSLDRQFHLKSSEKTAAVYDLANEGRKLIDAIAGRRVGMEGDAITRILADMKESGSWDAATMDRVIENVAALTRQSTGGEKT